MQEESQTLGHKVNFETTTQSADEDSITTQSLNKKAQQILMSETMTERREDE